MSNFEKPLNIIAWHAKLGSLGITIAKESKVAACSLIAKYIDTEAVYSV